MGSPNYPETTGPWKKPQRVLETCAELEEKALLGKGAELRADKELGLAASTWPPTSPVKRRSVAAAARPDASA